MKHTMKSQVIRTAILFLMFVLFTILVARFDVRPVGPEGSEVGFASVNHFVFQRIGVHLVWYKITDWLGIAAVLCALGFALLGLYQLLMRKSIRKVDSRILVLGGFYALVIACYLFFETVVINCRPVILGTEPEASYPSSHTMLVVCIMATAAIQVRALCPNKKGLCRAADFLAVSLSTITVIGRLLSGVHWLTDIAGALLLSAALVELYRTVLNLLLGRQ